MMADGLAAIAALIEGGDRRGIRQLRRELFLEEEFPAYDLLVQHYRDHGALPSREVFRRDGILLPQVADTFSYQVREVQGRAIFNACRDHHEVMYRAMRGHDQDGMVEAHRRLGIALGEVQASTNVRAFRAELGDVVEEYYAIRANPDNQGVTLGFWPLDQLTSRAQPGDLVVLVARPNVGKTYALLCMALAAWGEGASVLFLSMEMTPIQVTRRMLGLRSGLNPDMIRKGQLSTRGLSTMLRSVRELRQDDLPPFNLISGDFNKSTGDVDSLIQELRPDIAYIDASYLLSPQERKQARWEKVAQTHEELKAVAMNRGVPVVCTVQFNRAAKAGSRGAYDLSMIGNADAIGQVATVAVALREGPTNERHTQRRFAVMKNRDGPLGEFTTNFRFEPMNFDVVSFTQDVEGGEDAAEDEDHQAHARQMAEQMGDMR